MRVQNDHGPLHSAGESINNWILLDEQFGHVDAQCRTCDLKLLQYKSGHCFGVTFTALAVNITRITDSPVTASSFFNAESMPGIVLNAASALLSDGWT